MKILSKVLRLLEIAFIVANTIAIYLLFKDFSVLNGEVKNIKSEANYQLDPVITVAGGNEADLSAYATKDYVDESVSNIATPAPVKTETVTVVKETAPVQKQTTIIPISTTFTTQSLEWIDVPNSDFYLDLHNEYSESAIATWDVFLHEQHSNGKAEARLRDVTHGIVVVNSELGTNNGSSTLLSSGNLAIWRGKNLYRVQIKSEKGFPVYFNSGRLKITY